MATKTKVAATTNGSGDESFQQIVLERISKSVAIIKVEGVTPVIPHRFSEKAKKMMLQKHQGVATEKKAPKDPVEDANESMYWLDDGRPGIQAVAFKGAIADAARYFDKSVTIEMLKRIIHVYGEVNAKGEVVVPIVGEMQMREDTVRNSGGVADLRHRYHIWPWSAELHVEFISSLVTQASLISIVDAAGSNGVGDWRPSAPKSKTGTFGKFRVVDDAEVV